MSKIRHLVILTLFIVLISITACTRIIPFPKHNIHTSYKEWAENIGLYSTKQVRVNCYEADDKISISFETEGEISAYKEACDIINAHNKFVGADSAYFPDDIKISFHNMMGDEVRWYSVFFNDWQSNPRIEWIQELGRQDTAKIQYMWIDIDNSINEVNKSDDIKLDIPVIILDFDGVKSVEYDFLDEFTNAEQIIIFHCDSSGSLVDYDKEAECQLIKQHLPNVEIYNVFLNEQQNEYHLERLQ